MRKRFNQPPKASGRIGVSLVAASLAVLFSFFLFVAPPHGVQWRRDALESKLRGELPEWSWARLLAGIVPRTSTAHELYLTVGPVRFARRDEPSPCPVLWDTPLGPLWAWEEDQTYLLWHTKRWPYLQELFPEPPSIEPDSVVLEVGAWVGTFVREALNRGARKVIALEPEPANFVCLQKNFKDEIARGRVVLVKAAAWSHDGTERFGHPEFDEHGKPQLGGEGFRADPEGDVVVRTVKIDTLVEKLGLDRVDLIEMDVEGGERHALRGARRTLARFAPQILVCEHHLPDDDKAVPGEILAANPAYTRYTKGGHAYYRPPLKKTSDKRRGGLLSSEAL